MLGLTACGENIFEATWTVARVDTVLVYSLARPELNLPNGYDFVNRRTMEIHDPGATGQWDLIVDTQNGELVFLPPGGLDVVSEAMILKLPDMNFDDVVTAPKDTTLYSRDMPASVETSSVYVLRTHQGADRFGVPCVFWGKLQPLDVQPDVGTVRFMFDVSTLCDDRGLIPQD
jgi:hypothetical protein